MATMKVWDDEPEEVPVLVRGNLWVLPLGEGFELAVVGGPGPREDRLGRLELSPEEALTVYQRIGERLGKPADATGT